jgi:ABC-type transport system involved in multi-copper enzyme maturation permease subunit
MTVKTSWRLLRSFVGAELFKLRHSRLAKAVVVTMGLGSPVATTFVWLLGDETMSTFPRVLELIYLPLWLLVEMIGLLLAVEVMGSEFEQGTVRTVVGRGTPRWLFVGGKAIALLVAVSVYAVVGVLSGGFFATISHLSQLGTRGLVEGWREFFVSCLPAAGIATLAGSAYVGILLLLVVLTRSSALAMLGGLLIFGGDFIVVSGVPLGIEKFDPAGYSIFRCASALFYRAVEGVWGMGIISEGSQTPGRAFLTLALYAVAGVVLTYCVFKRQDLAGKK